MFVQCGRVLSDPNRRELREEGNLLIEAVSLLVQRQREIESWIAEQIWQAEERAAASERLYGEFEARLAGIEEHLARLADDVEPRHDEAGVDDRLERLRAQVEGLRSGADGRPVRTNPVLAAAAGAGPTERVLAASAGAGPRPVAEPGQHTAAASSGQGVTFWNLFGANLSERFGLVLIGVGAVAVLYAILTQLRF